MDLQYFDDTLSFVTKTDDKIILNSINLKEGNKSVTSYKCFSGEKFGLDYKEVILHRSAVDSWRCLLAFTNNPEYACIVNMNHI